MKAGGIVALVAGSALMLGGCLTGTAVVGGVVLAQQQAEAARCAGSGTGATVDPATLPAGAVAGYSGEQLVNAAHIMNAGAAMGLSVRDQTIGVMTAMGESGLRVLDRGDAVGPDSRGLFQQRDNGAWGSYEDRMDPHRSATSFFRVLATVAGREQMQPTRVANRVQRNADPDHYTRWWQPAVAVVDALTAAGTLTGSTPVVVAAAAPGPAAPVPAPVAGPVQGAGSTSRALCTDEAGTVVQVGAGGWTLPAGGSYTSAYGMRVNPVTGVYRLHGGLDLAPPCGAPIRAAASGVVVQAGAAASYGNLVVLDHGGGVATYYAHMYANDLLVSVGQQVPAGQQIARVGSAGNSTGCHLHFEVRLNGQRTDPAPFLVARGVALPARL